ncbi:hypothetical protein GE09DRAFT_1192039 [Coniochaeta sp. 2T2.1]|nr:hypothetical protein GE09DRAFT_1192039 [Coniochaeta sp. 2T2.1]
MPTVHVTPGADLQLQDIANALFKAKKVVVITGAGISTNSGIPDFRSENGLYALIQGQFDAASRELDKRAEERDAIRSPPPVMEAIEERPPKRRKLSVQEEISVKNEPELPAERGQTQQPTKHDERQRSPDREQSTARDEDVSMTDEGTSIIVAGDGDGDRSIRVALEDSDGVEDSIVILGERDADLSFSGASTRSPAASFAEADTEEAQPTTGHASEHRGVIVPTPNGSPGLLPRRPQGDPSTQNQADLGPSSDSGLPNNLSSSSRLSTPRSFRLSSDTDHHQASHPLSSSPLSSPPPILSDPYEDSSLERTYSRSESVSRNSDSSTSESEGSEETDDSNDNSGSSTPNLTPQSSVDSSQSRTTLPNIKGRDLFDASIWADPVRTSVFYTFATTLRQKARDVTPTTSHRFLSVLRDQRKLVRCYTQNIDRLEDRIGLATRLELGAGSRQRFSAKAWRKSAAALSNGPKGQGVLQPGKETGQEQQEQAAREPRAAEQESVDVKGTAFGTRVSTAVSTRVSGCQSLGAEGHPRRGHVRSCDEGPRGTDPSPSDDSDGSAPAVGGAPCTSAAQRNVQQQPPDVSALAERNVEEQPAVDSTPAEPDPGVRAATSRRASKPNIQQQPMRAAESGSDAGRADAAPSASQDALPAITPASSSGEDGCRSPEARQEPGEAEQDRGRQQLGGRLQLLGRRRGGGTPPRSGTDSSEPYPQAPPPGLSSAPLALSAPNRGVECVFLHGSLDSLRCFLCGQTSSWDDSERELETLAGRQPTCPHCAGATAAREERGKRALGVGKLRPDIVLYGEDHPHADLIGNIIEHDISLGPDMLLILGTSLRVHSLKTVVREFAKTVHSKGGSVVFVNFTKPPDSVWSDVIDFWVQWDCDAWVSDIKTRKPALWLPPGTVVDEEESKPSRGKRNANASTALRRTSTGLSQGSDKESTKTTKAKRKSNGTSEKLQKRNSNLSLVQESVCVSGTTTPINSSDDLFPSATSSFPSASYIPENISCEPSSSAQPGNSRARPAASRLIREALAAADANKQAAAKRSRKSLPGGKPAPPREVKLDPNAKRPQSIRDDVRCGAFLAWKIQEDLKRLTGQPKPSFLYSTAPQPKPKAARSKRPRQSAPAILSRPLQLPPTSQSVPFTPQPLAGGHTGFPRQHSHFQLRPYTLPFDPVYQCSPAMVPPSPFRQVSPAMSSPSVERPAHLSPNMSTPFRLLPPKEGLSQQALPQQEFTAENQENLPTPLEEKPTGRKGKVTKPRPKKVTAPKPLAIKVEAANQPLPVTSTPTVPVISPTSISAAIKTNPRKRKRKTIDGEEVVLPTAGRRPASARPSLPTVPQTPVQQPHFVTAPRGTPQTPGLFAPGPLPVPRPSVTPTTSRFANGLEHKPLTLPPMDPESSPATLGRSPQLQTMEPHPIFDPITHPLPVSNGQRKLSSFFDLPARRQVHDMVQCFEDHSLNPFLSPPFDDPFCFRNPLVSLPYQSRPPSVDPSLSHHPSHHLHHPPHTPHTPNPSEQLRAEQEAALSMSQGNPAISDQEAALSLSMLHTNQPPEVRGQYQEYKRAELERRELEGRRRREMREDRRCEARFVAFEPREFYGR